MWPPSLPADAAGAPLAEQNSTAPTWCFPNRPGCRRDKQSPGAHTPQLKAEKKVVAAGYKSRIEQLEAEATELGQVLESGEEFRPVECYEHINRLGKIVEIRRRDNDEVVSSRSLTPAEQQLVFEKMLADDE